jgi:hypothetical protein
MNYGIEYEPEAYRDPFDGMLTLLKDNSISHKIVNKKMDILDDMRCEAISQLSYYLNISSLIRNEALKLNSNEPTNSKFLRISVLQFFVTKQINDLIELRNSIKVRIFNEYEKIRTEKITKSYEDYGPVAIF